MKTHWKLYVEEELLSRYQRAAQTAGRRTPNEVAAEVLETYLEFWLQAEEAKAGMIAEQRAGLFEGGVYGRGKSGKGEIEKVKKDAISRTKKKR